MNNRIAIQGIRGAFHEQAARKHFGDETVIIECESFRNIFEKIENGLADHGIMAIENTIAGTLLSNYALLREFDLRIESEVFLNIHMNLLTLKGVKSKNIKFVESHPIALQQCHDFIDSRKLIARESFDTAGAAKELAKSKKFDTAVIAADVCAEIYDLEIKERGIETNKQNFTRFLVLSKDRQVDTPNKASLSLTLNHKPGSLNSILNVLTDHKINMTKIQSLPIIGKPYEYHFHMDLEWDKTENYERAKGLIKSISNSLVILGEYRKAKFQLNK